MNMQRNIKEGKHITVFYHTSKNYIHAWIRTYPEQAANDGLKKELIQLKKTIQSSHPKTLVLNIEDCLTSLSNTSIHWLESNFFTPINQIGLHRISIAYGKNIYAAITLENIIHKDIRHRYSLASFSDESEAISWSLQIENRKN
jgi:hypothetical protein